MEDMKCVVRALDMQPTESASRVSTLHGRSHSEAVRRYAHEVIDNQILPIVYNRRPPIRTNPVTDAELMEMQMDDGGLSRTGSRSGASAMGPSTERSDADGSSVDRRGYSKIGGGGDTNSSSKVVSSMRKSDSNSSDISTEELHMALTRDLQLKVPSSEAEISEAQLPVNVAQTMLEVADGLPGGSDKSGGKQDSVSPGALLDRSDVTTESTKVSAADSSSDRYTDDHHHHRHHQSTEPGMNGVMSGSSGMGSLEPGAGVSSSSKSGSSRTTDATTTSSDRKVGGVTSASSTQRSDERKASTSGVTSSTAVTGGSSSSSTAAAATAAASSSSASSKGGSGSGTDTTGKSSSRSSGSIRKKYEVLVQARVRLGEDLGSPQITDLPEGTSVTVAEIKGRRARIVRPIHGWLSTHTKMGGRILIPLDSNFSKVGRGVMISDPSSGLPYQGKIIDYDEKRQRHKVRLTTGKEMFVDLNDPCVTLQQDSYQRAMKNKLSGDAPIYDPKAPAHMTGHGRMALFHKIFANDYPTFVQRAREKVMRQQQQAQAQADYSRAQAAAHAMSHGMRPTIGGGGSRHVGSGAIAAAGADHSRGVGSSSRSKTGSSTRDVGSREGRGVSGTGSSSESRTDADRIKKWMDYFDKFSRDRYPEHLKLYLQDLSNRGMPATPEIEERYKVYYEKKLREKEKFLAKHKQVLQAKAAQEGAVPPGGHGGSSAAAAAAAAAAAGKSSSKSGGKKHSSGSGGAPRGLIVLRGLPGSGKTSLARKLAVRSPDAKVCTEDKYHWSGGEDGVGEYQFKPELVFLAREWCTKEIRSFIKQGINLIILDNHNARISMYEDHIQYAVKYGYRFRIIEFLGTEEHIDRYRERSYKKFPREVYVKLLKLWEKDPRAEIVNPVFVPASSSIEGRVSTTKPPITAPPSANHSTVTSSKSSKSHVGTADGSSSAAKKTVGESGTVGQTVVTVSDATGSAIAAVASSTAPGAGLAPGSEPKMEALKGELG